MNDLTSELLNLKRQSDEATRRMNEAQGAFDQCLSQIKNEFGCDTIEEAEEKAKELANKEMKLRKTLKKKIDKYKEDFAEWIDNEEDEETEMDLEI